jgi:hypothetical protein
MTLAGAMSLDCVSAVGATATVAVVTPQPRLARGTESMSSWPIIGPSVRSLLSPTPVRDPDLADNNVR